MNKMIDKRYTGIVSHYSMYNTNNAAVHTKNNGQGKALMDKFESVTMSIVAPLARIHHALTRRSFK